MVALIDLVVASYLIIGSFILCFNAGFINCLTLSTFHGAPTAHVTGMIAKVMKGKGHHHPQPVLCLAPPPPLLLNPLAVFPVILYV